MGDNVRERILSHRTTTIRPTRGESDEESPPPTTAQGSGSDRAITPIAPPSPPFSVPLPPSAPPMTAKPDPPRPGVRFSDDVTLFQSPGSEPVTTAARRPPWAMHRRGPSSISQPMPEWGVLFDGDGFATARCGQVLRGLARCLVCLCRFLSKLCSP